MRKTTILTLLLLAGQYLAACDSDNNPNDNPGDTALSWTDCDEGNLQCATLSVPIDYSHSEAGDSEAANIGISLIRHAATNERKGSLLLNPGGPGGSGVSLLQEFISYDAFPDSILASFDVIGFDPRGVGNSHPVDCDEFGLDEINSYPLDEEDVTDMHAEIVSFATKCSKKYGSYLQHLGSANVARDMDRIRQALGDDKLNFIGYSYGTRLGALYLQMFPESSGQIVLDASLPPQSDIAMLTSGQLDQMQTNIQKILGSCLEENPDCDPAGLLTQLTERINGLISDNSAESGDAIELVGDIVITATLDLEFAELAAESIVDYADSGDISSFISLLSLLEALEEAESAEAENEETDSEEGADEDDNIPEDDEDNATSEVAIMCADDAARPDVAALLTTLNDYNNRSDLFAEYLMPQQALCSGWPEAIEPLPPIVVSTAPISLVIGGTNDAQTPLQWSESMASSIGGVFVTSEHAGHTAAFNDSSECVSDIVEAFLLDNLIPDTLYCGQE